MLVADFKNNSKHFNLIKNIIFQKHKKMESPNLFPVFKIKKSLNLTTHFSKNKFMF